MKYAKKLMPFALVLFMVLVLKDYYYSTVTLFTYIYAFFDSVVALIIGAIILHFIKDRKQKIEEKPNENYRNYIECKNCGNSIPSFFNYCNKCGIKNEYNKAFAVEERIYKQIALKRTSHKCDNCQSLIIDGDKYCFICGNELNEQ